MDRPEKPSSSDCCGSGCTPCVFDVYEELLEKWKVSKAEIRNPKTRHDLLSPLKYTAYELLRIEAVNENANIYTFKPAGTVNDAITEGILPYKAGQHLIALNDKPDKVKEKTAFSRSYTPINLPQMEDNCRVKFLIKLYQDGAMSKFISQLKLNDVMYFRGPFGNFHHTPHSKYIMICAGTGFAPIYTVIKSILLDEGDETTMKLFFACSSLSDIYFRDEIREFCKYWNFTASIYVSTPLRGQVRHDENIRQGKISSHAIDEIFAIGYRILICGSESFNADMVRYAEQAGVGKDDLFIF